MSEWLDYLSSYSLSDFLLFSSRTYYRLIELYNLAIFPAQVGLLLLGFAMFWLLLRHRGRAVAAILAFVWAWVAVAFHLERYATINWAAVYVAIAFIAQVLLLLWFGVIRDKMTLDTGPSRRRDVGLMLVGFALVVQPFAALIAGRPLTQFEVFGATPDATAVATLGVALLIRDRSRWVFAVIPLAWCVIGGLTLYGLDAPEAAIMPFAALAMLATAVAVRGGRHRPQFMR